MEETVRQIASGYMRLKATKARTRGARAPGDTRERRLAKSRVDRSRVVVCPLAFIALSRLSLPLCSPLFDIGARDAAAKRGW